MAVVAVRLFGGEGDGRARRAATTAAPATDPLSYPRLGVRLERPLGWTAELEDGVIRLRSGDGTAGVAVFTAPMRRAPTRVRRDLERRFEQAYRDVELLRRGRGTLGSAPAVTAELSARTRAGDPLALAVLAARSAHRTYGVALFSGGRLAAGRAREIEAVLGSLRYFAPAG